MPEKIVKCPFCGGEQYAEGNDAIKQCRFCEIIFNISEALSFYKKNGMAVQTPEKITNDEKRLKQLLFHIHHVNGTIINREIGEVQVHIKLENENPMPIVRMKLEMVITDESGREVQASHSRLNIDTINESLALKRGDGLWDVTMEKNIYLTGECLQLSDVYIVVNSITLFYADNRIETVNYPFTNILRDDPVPFNTIQFININRYRGDRLRSNRQQVDSEKSWMVYAFLGIILGYFGVHNFYAGNRKRAVIQLILSLTIIGASISVVWAFLFDVIPAMCNHSVPDYS